MRPLGILRSCHALRKFRYGRGAVETRADAGARGRGGGGLCRDIPIRRTVRGGGGRFRSEVDGCQRGIHRRPGVGGVAGGGDGYPAPRDDARSQRRPIGLGGDYPAAMAETWPRYSPTRAGARARAPLAGLGISPYPELRGYSERNPPIGLWRSWLIAPQRSMGRAIIKVRLRPGRRAKAPGRVATWPCATGGDPSYWDLNYSDGIRNFPLLPGSRKLETWESA